MISLLEQRIADMVAIISKMCALGMPDAGCRTAIGPAAAGGAGVEAGSGPLASIDDGNRTARRAA